MDLQVLNPLRLRLRLCSGLKVLGYLMIFLVLAIVALSYYAVVVLTWAPHLLDGAFHSFFSFFIILLFHYLLVLLIWSYVMVVLRDPGSVPENWELISQGEGNMEEGNSTATPSHLGAQNSASTTLSSSSDRPPPAVRYCSHCQNGKPPRCHHCSICQRCVLKMDHHCIWVVNCVGAQNYKFFLLFVDPLNYVLRFIIIHPTFGLWLLHQLAGTFWFSVVVTIIAVLVLISFLPLLLNVLFYTFLETTMDTLVLLPSFINFFEQAKHRSLSPGNLAVTFLAFVLNLAFALSLLCFVMMHTSLLLSNTTSVEVYEKKRAIRWKYDLGRKRNFEQVFGTKKLLWFFPLFSDEDLKNIPALGGLEFPICSDVSE